MDFRWKISGTDKEFVSYYHIGEISFFVVDTKYPLCLIFVTVYFFSPLSEYFIVKRRFWSYVNINLCRNSSDAYNYGVLSAGINIMMCKGRF